MKNIAYKSGLFSGLTDRLHHGEACSWKDRKVRNIIRKNEVGMYNPSWKVPIEVRKLSIKLERGVEVGEINRICFNRVNMMQWSSIVISHAG